jgi:hypothetical protein
MPADPSPASPTEMKGCDSCFSPWELRLLCNLQTQKSQFGNAARVTTPVALSFLRNAFQSDS